MKVKRIVLEIYTELSAKFMLLFTCEQQQIYTDWIKKHF